MNALRPEQMTGLFMMFAVVAVLAIAGYLIAMVVRGRLLREQPQEAFTLQDLRQLQARGEISNEEYERMRAVILGKAAERKRAADQKAREDSTDSDIGETDAPQA